METNLLSRTHNNRSEVKFLSQQMLELIGMSLIPLRMAILGKLLAPQTGVFWRQSAVLSTSQPIQVPHGLQTLIHGIGLRLLCPLMEARWWQRQSPEIIPFMFQQIMEQLGLQPPPQMNIGVPWLLRQTAIK